MSDNSFLRCIEDREMAEPPISDDDLASHLSQLATAWEDVARLREGPSDAVREAQERLLKRYQRPIYRYLLAATRDPHVADDLCQEFGLRLVRGDFRNVDPGRGRFRDFVKTVLYHLVVDHQRKRQRQPEVLAAEQPEMAVSPAADVEAEREFVELWKAELLTRTWEALAQHERRLGEPLHTVLRHRYEHPEARSHEMAKTLGPQFGKALTAEWIRKYLMLARSRFAELLLEEVTCSLGTPTVDEVEEELISLRLLGHCQDALKRRREAGPRVGEWR